MRFLHSEKAADGFARLAAILSEYGPSAGLFFAGFPIVFDYGRTGRIDLLLGGLFVSLFGVILADHISGHHVFPAMLRRVLGGRFPVHDKLPLVMIGLSTTFTLCIGESLRFIGRHGADLADCVEPCALEDMARDPSTLKILATALLFPAASLINIPSVHGRLERFFNSTLHIKCLQNVLAGSGSVLIGLFGVFVHAFSAMTFGALCGGAHLISFTIRSHALRRARLAAATAAAA